MMLKIIINNLMIAPKPMLSLIDSLKREKDVATGPFLPDGRESHIYVIKFTFFCQRKN